MMSTILPVIVRLFQSDYNSLLQNKIYMNKNVGAGDIVLFPINVYIIFHYIAPESISNTDI